MAYVALEVLTGARSATSGLSFGDGFRAMSFTEEWLVGAALAGTVSLLTWLVAHVVTTRWARWSWRRWTTAFSMFPSWNRECKSIVKGVVLSVPNNTQRMRELRPGGVEHGVIYSLALFAKSTPTEFYKVRVVDQEVRSICMLGTVRQLNHVASGFISVGMTDETQIPSVVGLPRRAEVLTEVAPDSTMSIRCAISLLAHRMRSSFVPCRSTLAGGTDTTSCLDRYRAATHGYAQLRTDSPGIPRCLTFHKSRVNPTRCVADRVLSRTALGGEPRNGRAASAVTQPCAARCSLLRKTAFGFFVSSERTRAYAIPCWLSGFLAAHLMALCEASRNTIKRMRRNRSTASTAADNARHRRETFTFPFTQVVRLRHGLHYIALATTLGICFFTWPQVVSLLVFSPFVISAYVAPSTRSAGALITAAIWNQDVVANPIAIYGGAMSIASQATDDFIVAASATQLGRQGSADVKLWMEVFLG